MFLSDLIKNTPDSDPGKQSLIAASALADDLASQLDKSKDFADRIHKILIPGTSECTHDSRDISLSLAHSTRDAAVEDEGTKMRIRDSYLMGEGVIDLLLDPHDYLGIEAHLWVFNDMILCTVAQKDSQRHLLRWKSDLINCSLEFRM